MHVLKKPLQLKHSIFIAPLVNISKRALEINLFLWQRNNPALKDIETPILDLNKLSINGWNGYNSLLFSYSGNSVPHYNGGNNTFPYQIYDSEVVITFHSCLRRIFGFQY